MKFFNDQNWKVSPYVSSQICSFILTTLVGVIEKREQEISEVINSRLYVLLVILKNKENHGISLSYVSQLMLKHEYNINTTA